MKEISNIADLNESSKVAISMGNFDGVHLGHQALLKKALKESREKNYTFGVITFVPHPSEVFKGVKDFYINTFIERRELLKNLGIDFIVELPFDEAFAKLKPEEFLNDYILKIKNLKKLFLGHDFALGKDKSGDLNFIENFIKPHNVELDVEEEFLLKGSDVCSSRIRKLLKEGDVKTANTLLGRNFFLRGEVVPGLGRGRRIGIPTMNIEPAEKRLVPGRGVYVTKTELDGLENVSLTNIGLNPTFENDDRVKVETHLIDFDKKSYGKDIQVNFIEKIRDEKKFNGPDELIEQINRDVAYTREKYL